MTTIEFQLPGYVRPPLSLNDRMHWAKRARVAKELRILARTLTRQTVGRRGWRPCLPVEITLVWRVTDARRRDADNPHATRKHIVDGVCEALGIDDDHTMVTGGCVIERGDVAGVWVRVVDSRVATGIEVQA